MILDSKNPSAGCVNNARGDNTPSCILQSYDLEVMPTVAKTVLEWAEKWGRPFSMRDFEREWTSSTYDIPHTSAERYVRKLAEKNYLIRLKKGVYVLNNLGNMRCSKIKGIDTPIASSDLHLTRNTLLHYIPKNLEDEKK